MGLPGAQFLDILSLGNLKVHSIPISSWYVIADKKHIKDTKSILLSSKCENIAIFVELKTQR